MSIATTVSEGYKFGDNIAGKPVAGLQAASRLKPTDVHPKIRKKVEVQTKAAAERSEAEKKAAAASEPTAKELIAKAREQFKKTPDIKKPDENPDEKSRKPVEPEARRFQRWLSSPGKGKFESIKEATDLGAMHSNVASALKKLGPHTKHDVARKQKLARAYRKVQQA